MDYKEHPMDALDANARVDLLLKWLQEAEDDLGDLAEIVEALAARQGASSYARKANDIKHRWAHRRARRQLRELDAHPEESE